MDVFDHLIRSNAGKKVNTIPELFIKQKIVFNFVYFSSAQTLSSASEQKFAQRCRLATRHYFYFLVR